MNVDLEFIVLVVLGQYPLFFLLNHLHLLFLNRLSARSARVPPTRDASGLRLSFFNLRVLKYAR